MTHVAEFSSVGRNKRSRNPKMCVWRCVRNSTNHLYFRCDSQAIVTLQWTFQSSRSLPPISAGTTRLRNAVHIRQLAERLVFGQHNSNIEVKSSLDTNDRLRTETRSRGWRFWPLGTRCNSHRIANF